MNSSEINSYIKNNMSLFKAIAVRVQRNLPTFAKSYDYEDITQAVLEMSIIRLKSYNKDKGSDIPNYLYQSAYYDAIRYIKDNFSLIRRPAYLLENATSFARMSRLYNYSDKEIVSRLQIPECRLASILAVLNGTYEPLSDVFLSDYKDYDSDLDKGIYTEDLNKYIYNRVKTWNQRDKDVLKYLILKEGKETTRTLGKKYNVSYNCIHLKKKAIIHKLQKMVLNYRPNIKEELLND